MKCENCGGTGENAKGLTCFICNGFGNTCDVCGEASEEDLCDECREEDAADEARTRTGGAA